MIAGDQPIGIDVARRAVLGHVLGDHVLSDELDQQIHRDDGLARSGPASDDQHVPLTGALRFARKMRRSLKDDLLVVDHHELVVAFEHSDQCVLERLARAQFAVLDVVEDLTVITMLDVAADEVAQLGHVAFTERGGICLLYTSPSPRDS